MQHVTSELYVANRVGRGGAVPGPCQRTDETGHQYDRNRSAPAFATRGPKIEREHGDKEKNRENRTYLPGFSEPCSRQHGPNRSLGECLSRCKIADLCGEQNKPGRP